MGVKKKRIRRKSFTEHVAEELAYLLDYKFNSKELRYSKPFKLVRTVFKVMAEALLRGERIHIQGFGIFEIRTKRPTRCAVRYFDRVGSYVPISHWEVLPAKKYVHFSPSSALKRFVNTGVKNVGDVDSTSH